MRKIIAFAILSAALLVQTSPIPQRALQLGPDGLVSEYSPAGLVPILPPSQADFSRTGAQARLELAGGHLAIVTGDRVVWSSPPAWTVVQAEITDLNRDGSPEAALLVWRPFQPWPVDQWLPHGGRIAGFQDSRGYSCHIILIGWRGSAYGELWAGSALAEPVRSFAAADLNGDHTQELITLESSYARPWTFHAAPAQALKVWEWNGFGFSIVSKMEGAFDKLALAQANSGHILILVP